ncbi:hypothetical protein QBC47DRAFT_152902 [Echria macrotheca]|uniref:Uncharacterized protein n=1 Tax=Echria macrotheca TaxID=438768 RepID=A0AAJ0B1X5_9PEZI|nr:hypothetical protein QBC47DRAFT_152902 [Echria macrotheca]
MRMRRWRRLIKTGAHRNLCHATLAPLAAAGLISRRRRLVGSHQACHGRKQGVSSSVDSVSSRPASHRIASSPRGPQHVPITYHDQTVINRCLVSDGTRWTPLGPAREGLRGIRYLTRRRRPTFPSLCATSLCGLLGLKIPSALGSLRRWVLHPCLPTPSVRIVLRCPAQMAFQVEWRTEAARADDANRRGWAVDSSENRLFLASPHQPAGLVAQVV